jgi:hypothetical protein
MRLAGRRSLGPSASPCPWSERMGEAKSASASAARGHRRRLGPRPPAGAQISQPGWYTRLTSRNSTPANVALNRIVLPSAITDDRSPLWCCPMSAAAVERRSARQKLPETALRATSPSPTTRPSTALLTCATVWAREVLRGIVNSLRIDGKDEATLEWPLGGVVRPCRVVRFARLIHRRVRVLGGPAVRAACGGSQTLPWWPLGVACVLTVPFARPTLDVSRFDAIVVR